jgi:hypothetical protein
MRGVCRGSQSRSTKLSSIDNVAVATTDMAGGDLPGNNVAEDVSPEPYISGPERQRSTAKATPRHGKSRVARLYVKPTRVIDVRRGGLSLHPQRLNIRKVEVNHRWW